MLQGSRVTLLPLSEHQKCSFSGFWFFYLRRMGDSENLLLRCFSFLHLEDSVADPTLRIWTKGGENAFGGL